uniref:Uncharacterized protein n=1 Tax=Octopus bimaculoides TaxID=37653 RepID=A0A0L8HJP0_OCTBM
MRYKDFLKFGLKKINVPIDNWEDLVHCREKEKKVVHEGKNEFERKRMQHAKIKRKMRKSDNNFVLTSINERDDLTRDECRKICPRLSNIKTNMKYGF